jgi:enoyl-CoA hydratase
MTGPGVRTATLDDHPYVQVVTIDNPPVNAVNLGLFAEIRRIFEGIEGDGKIRSVVLTGAGTRAFVGGADVKGFLTRVPGNSLNQSRVARNCFDSIRECVVPVIGAINGPALGAGLAIAAACDVLIASDNATFGLPEINVGILGGAKHLSLLVPQKQLRWMALSGSRLRATDLAAFGGVLEVVSPDQLFARALALADDLAGKSPSGLRLQKECLNLIEEMGLYDGYHVEQLGTAIVSGLADSKEAAAAFLEKRKPHFD